ncbi:MAG: diguanylate cyclase (GGDEF)-like protein [Bacteroidia bacterium]|jgi:diguanylate cyclase (GGDEF)-like protein
MTTHSRIDRLQFELVDILVRLLTYSSALLLPLFMWRAVQERDVISLPTVIVPLIVAVLLIGLHLLRNRLSATTRACVLSLLLVIASIFGLISRGILGSALVFMVMAIICLSLILPLRQLLLAGTVIVCADMAVILLYFSGAFVIDIDPVQAFSSPALWLSYSIVPIYASIIIMVVLSQYSRRIAEVFKELEDEKSAASYLSEHDPLTGLPNTRVMDIRAHQAILMANRGKSKPALLFIDLDHFKTINDKFGHAVGDLMLQEVASRIRLVVREEDIAARAGGDEFLVLLPHTADSSEAGAVAQKICAVLEKPFYVHDDKIFISASVGIALWPEHGNDLKSLTRSADHAMYAAKNSGKNAFKVFVSSVENEVL